MLENLLFRCQRSPILIAAMLLTALGFSPLSATNAQQTEASREQKIQELEVLLNLAQRALRELKEAHSKEAKPAAESTAPSPSAAPQPVVAEGVPAVRIDFPPEAERRAAVHKGNLAANVTVGWEFQPTAPIQINELGVIDPFARGLHGDLKVAIWNIAGQMVASATIPKGKDTKVKDHFRYVPISPVQLEPGKTYIIGGFYPRGSDDMILDQGVPKVSFAAPIRWIASRRGVTEELAVPRARTPGLATTIQSMGGFGPTFSIVKSEATLKPRNVYRFIQLPSGMVTELDIALETETEEEFLARQQRLTPIVQVFALPNGTIGQLVVGGTPLGKGEDAFKKLSFYVRSEREKLRGRKMVFQIVHMARVSKTELSLIQKIVAAGTHQPSDNSPVAVIDEVPTVDFAHGHVKQLSKDGEFVDAGRFVDKGEVILDTWTGLFWQKDGTAAPPVNFYDAAKYASNLELGEMKDWRVPTIEELATIFPANFGPFKNSKYNPGECCGGPAEYAGFWTSELDTRLPDYAFIYQWYNDGGANNCYASRNRGYVRCVRTQE